jgi:hypothetical protein
VNIRAALHFFGGGGLFPLALSFSPQWAAGQIKHLGQVDYIRTYNFDEKLNKCIQKTIENILKIAKKNYFK